MALVIVGGIRCGTGAVSAMLSKIAPTGRWAGNEVRLDGGLEGKIKSGDCWGFKAAALIYSADDLSKLAKIKKVNIIVIKRAETDRLLSHINMKFNFTRPEDVSRVLDLHENQVRYMRSRKVDDNLINAAVQIFGADRVHVFNYEDLDTYTFRNKISELIKSVWKYELPAEKLRLEVVKPSRHSVLNIFPYKIRMRMIKIIPIRLMKSLNRMKMRKHELIDAEILNWLNPPHH